MAIEFLAADLMPDKTIDLKQEDIKDAQVVIFFLHPSTYWNCR